MNSVTLITKTKITSEKVSQNIINNFPYKKNIIVNNNQQLFIGTAPREFNLIFDESYNVEDIDSMFELEEKIVIPFENGFVTELYYRSIDILKPVINSIYEVYPELFVFCDVPDYIGSAEGIIKNETEELSISDILDDLFALNELINTEVNVSIDKIEYNVFMSGFIKNERTIKGKKIKALILNENNNISGKEYFGTVQGIIYVYDTKDIILLVSNKESDKIEIEEKLKNFFPYKHKILDKRH